MSDPLKEALETVARIQAEMERAFRDLWTRFYRSGVDYGLMEPPADIEDRGNEYVVFVDLPGFSKEDIRIKLRENLVEIRAERSLEQVSGEGEKRYLMKQRVYRGFRKIIELPEKIRPADAKAYLRNGVLELHLPKSGESIEIELKPEESGGAEGGQASY